MALVPTRPFVGLLVHGQHRLAPKENTPLANLWTTMLQDAGVAIDRFADANATASSILAG